MQWSTALNAVRDKVRALDTYVDESGVVADTKQAIGKHAPAALRSELTSAVDLLDRMLNALANDPDDIPDVPATS